MSRSSTTVSGIKWSTFSMLFTTIVMMAQVVVLGRFLEPTEYGILALVMLIIGLSEIFVNFGLSEAIVQNEVISSGQLSSLFFANVLFSVFVFFVFSLMLWLFFPFGDYVMLCVVAVSSVVINSFSLQFKALSQRNFLFDLLATIEIISYAIGFIFLLIALSYGFGLWSVIIGFLIRTTVSVICHVNHALKKKWLPGFYFNINEIREQLEFGFNLLGANLLNYISSRFDQAVIGAILGPNALGYYSMAFNLVIQPMQKLNPVVTKVAFPILARLQDSREELTKGYINLLLAVVLLNTPIMLSLYYLAPYFVGPVLGVSWLPVIPLLQILSFYSLLRATGNAGATLVLATGNTGILLRWNLLVTALQPILIFLSASLGEVDNVAMALVIMQLLLLFSWYRIVVVKAIGSCFKNYTASIFAPVLYFGLILFTIEQVLLLFGLSSIASKIGIVLVSCIFYCATVFLMVKRGYLFNMGKVV